MTQEERIKLLSIERENSLAEFIPVMRPKTADLLVKTIQVSKPKQILEIGTCIGLGVISMLLASSDTFVTSLEIDEERYLESKERIKKYGLESRCRLILGDCKEIVPCLTLNRYDFVVLDGPKSYYKDAYPVLMDILNINGIIFIDDILFHGMTEGKEYPDHKHRTNVVALRTLVHMIENDERVSFQKIDIEDGVMIVKKEKE